MRQGRPDAPRGVHLVDDVVVAGVLSSRGDLHELVLGQLGALPDGAEEAHAGSHDRLVDGVAERVVQHLGGALRVRGVDGDGAAGEGLLEADEDALAAGADRVLDHSGVLVLEEVGEDLALGLDTGDELLAALVDGGEVRVVLLGLDLLGDSGVGLGRDLREGDHGEAVAAALGEGAGLVGLVLGPGGGVECWVGGEGGAVRCAREGLVEGDEGVGVVLKVCTDAVVGELHGDASSLEDRLGSDAAELEELGGVDGAGGEDDLLVGVHGGGLSGGLVEDLDTLGGELLLGVEHELRGLGAEQELEVGPSRLDRVIVGVACLGTLSGEGVHGVGIPRDTGLLAIVAIKKLLDTGTLVGGEEGLDIRVLEVGDTNVERTITIAATSQWRFP